MHWQNNNTINECIIILLDIHGWSKRDGKAWLLGAIASHSLLSEGNPLFVSTAIIFFNTFFFHHHTLFTLLPRSDRLSQRSSFFFFPFPTPTFSHFHGEMKTSQWEWIGIWEWCVCVRACLCLSALVCFMTLSSVDEREEVSSVIYSDQPSCPICVWASADLLFHTLVCPPFHISQSRSFAPHALPPRPPLICLFSDNSSRSSPTIKPRENLWSVG